MTKLALIFLALLALVCLLGAIIIDAIGKPVPSELWAGFTALVTGILGVLIPREPVNPGESSTQVVDPI